METNVIYNEDCLIGMDRILDRSVDMILCDLPYGTTRNKWDSMIDLDKLWLQYNRIIKDNGAIVLTAQTPFDKVLGVSNLKNLRYEWIWHKTRATGHLNAKKMPMKEHENILVFYKKLPTYNPQLTYGEPYTVIRNTKGSSNYREDKEEIRTLNNGFRYPKTILTFKPDRGLHPTQKPVDLFEYLIKTYTNDGEIVLDNCMGSGTTAIACLKTGRKFIGFENDKEYFKKSLKRIKNFNETLDYTQ